MILFDIFAAIVLLIGTFTIIGSVLKVLSDETERMEEYSEQDDDCPEDLNQG
ncbi:MAG: hypothetical protein HUJ96_04600 [Marinilabiliaceae bacterium]|nr:hypothetical protein [Marinilabiliaceae bacterium]